MLENNSTYGSIITTKREKQILAKKSYEYNLNDPLFCELFPDIADVCYLLVVYLQAWLMRYYFQEIKYELEKRKEAESAANSVNKAVKGLGNQLSSLINSENLTTVSPAATGPQSNRFLWSILYNLIAVFILVIFFYVVRFILRESNMFGSSAS